jgi:hypothetical protein
MMPSENLPPDPDSVTKWKQLPQNAPSKEALPPMTGGTRWVWGLLILLAIVIVFGLLQGRG